MTLHEIIMGAAERAIWERGKATIPEVVKELPFGISFGYASRMVAPVLGSLAKHGFLREQSAEPHRYSLPEKDDGQSD